MNISICLRRIMLMIFVVLGAGCAQHEVKKIGMVIQLKPEYMDQYQALHADSYHGVRDLLSKYHLKNFNIFIQKLDDGNYYEFGFYEYHGTDYNNDMAGLAKEQRNIEWLKICDAMQLPLKGYESWAIMERIFYNP